MNYAATIDYLFTRLPMFTKIGAGAYKKDLHNIYLLEEARQKLYTEPAGSVKYGQYEAALRIYYFTRIRDVFPHLFSPQEEQEIQQWFQQINQR